MFRNRKCQFVPSAFGPKHEGGSKEIRRLQRETERGPEEGKVYKQHLILLYLLIKFEVCLSSFMLSTNGKHFKTLHTWRRGGGGGGVGSLMCYWSNKQVAPHQTHTIG